MSVASTVPTSRRCYLSQAELQQFADITVTDATEADDQISQAEEIVDSYVGPQLRFYNQTLVRRASAGGGSTLTLHADDQNIFENDYFKWCQVEIIGGTGEGQRRTITTSTKAGVLTVQTAWTSAPDSTSMYKIYQLGKFPRYRDVTYYTQDTPYTYYKSIPEQVKRAVAAQVEFIIAMGASYFSTDKSMKQSESIGDYSYTMNGGLNGSSNPLSRMIAPKAKIALRGIMVRSGEIEL